MVEALWAAAFPKAGAHVHPLSLLCFRDLQTVTTNVLVERGSVLFPCNGANEGLQCSMALVRMERDKPMGLVLLMLDPKTQPEFFLQYIKAQLVPVASSICVQRPWLCPMGA